MVTARLALPFALSALFLGCGDPLSNEDSGVSLEEPESAWSSLSKGAGGVNGDNDYCNHPAFLCVSGEGDCDYTYQCTAGLVCGVDNGSNFGFGLLTDVCVITACTNGVQDGTETGVDCGNVECGGACADPCASVDPIEGSAGHCSNTCQCAPGHGDCDSNLQCLTGLTCATDVGPSYGYAALVDVCEGSTCTNGLLDGDEIGIDCGGSCSPCAAVSGWVDSIGNAAANVTSEIAVDLVDGSVYVAGQFTGTLDSGVGQLVSNGSLDFYVIKYDINGVPLWARSYGGTLADGDTGIGLAVDPVTRRLAIGTNFQTTADFGGGNLTAVNSYDAVLVVLDSAGNFVSATRYGDVGLDRFDDVRWDRFGNLFGAATFTTSINFGGANLVSAGGLDIAVMKRSGALAHLWSARFGGTGTDQPNDLAVDYDGRPIVVGQFSGTATFGVTNLVSAGLLDAFVLKLFGTNGTVSFVKAYGSAGTDNALGVVADNARNVYVVGGFKRTLDFGGGVLTAAGVSDKLDGFVLGLTSTGVFRWVRQMGSTDHDTFATVAVDTTSSDIAVGGYFKLTLAGFDETGVDVVSAGGMDALAMTIDSATGNTQKVDRYGTVADEYTTGVDRDGATVELFGVFSNTMSIGGQNVTSAGLTDAWVAHFPVF